MVAVTGDIHGDFERFNKNDVKKLKKGDTLIVCGDFGLVWDGSAEEEKKLKALGKRKYQTLFLDGVHENFELLKSYPVTGFMGGKARVINKNLVHLMRGEVYTIEDRTFFCMGGGTSADKDFRMKNNTWWEEEAPSEEELDNGTKNLEKHNNFVNYVITFEAPAKLKRILSMSYDGSGGDDISNLNTYLERINGNITFDRWYFGCHHLDKVITPMHSCVYGELVEIK